MKKIETDFLILGAGWSGLVAADLLAKKGKNIVILEKEAEVGGLARTFVFKSFKFDIGGHGLFIKKQENLDYLRNIANHDTFLTLRRKSKILFNNTYIDYPPNLLSVFRLDKKYILNISFDILSLKKQRKLNNFEEWVRINYGECLYRIYFKDYTEKVWGKSCCDLSSDWAEKRIGNNSLFRLLRGLLINQDSYKEGGQFFYFPREGIGTLPNLLEKKIGDRCTVYKNVQLNRFVMSNNHLSSLNFNLGNIEHEISFKNIISSIPLVELLKILPAGMVSKIQHVQNEIKYRNLILVNLILDKEIVTNWHWCYFPSKEIIFSRLHEPKFWSKDMASKSKTLLCAEIFCNSNDEMWKAKEEGLIDLVKKTFRSTGFNSNVTISDANVKKIEYTYPLCYNEFEKPLRYVKDFLRTFTNLYLVGRNGTHSYFNMEECLENVKVTIDCLFNKEHS